jgi:large subunit ribosomal protein L33
VGSPVRVRPPLLFGGAIAPVLPAPVADTGQSRFEEADVAKNEKRVKVTLECEVCKRRNYITTKNKNNDRERIEMRKYCRFDRVHTLHKETR